MASGYAGVGLDAVALVEWWVGLWFVSMLIVGAGWRLARRWRVR